MSVLASAQAIVNETMLVGLNPVSEDWPATRLARLWFDAREDLLDIAYTDALKGCVDVIQHLFADEYAGEIDAELVEEYLDSYSWLLEAGDFDREGPIFDETAPPVEAVACTLAEVLNFGFRVGAVEPFLCPTVPGMANLSVDVERMRDTAVLHCMDALDTAGEALAGDPLAPTYLKELL